MYGVDRRDIDSCGFSWSEQADADLLRPFPVQLLPGVLVLEAVNGLVHQELDVGTDLLQGMIDGMRFIGRFLNGELIGLAGEFRVEPVRYLELLKDINGPLVHSLHPEVADAVVFLFLESGFFLQFPAGGVNAGGEVFVVCGVGAVNRCGIIVLQPLPIFFLVLYIDRRTVHVFEE